MTGLSLPRKSHFWYSYVSVHLFCFVFGLAWTKNYFLRQEEKHNKRKKQSIVILLNNLMPEIIAIKTNLLGLLLNPLFRFWGNTRLLSSRTQPIRVLSGHTELQEGFAHMYVRQEKLWRISLALAIQSVQPCAQWIWKTPNDICSILNFWITGIDMLDPSNFNIQFQYERQYPKPQKLQGSCSGEV